MIKEDVNLSATRIDYIKVRPKPGSSITRVLREAAIIALSEQIEVRFTFNGEDYTISPGDLLFILETNNGTKGWK